jgi:hypothetical protein
MEINYSNYKIDIAEIREYERTCTLLSKTSEVLALKILKKIEAVISNKREPVFGLKDYNSDDKYYRDYKKRHEDALNDAVERFNLNFFFINGDCFDYDENIIIDNTFIDFDSWFVLKLRQYQNNPSEIKNFLNFQFETNFNNDIKEFVRFLNFSIHKHQAELLEKSTVDTVDDLIESNFENKLILKIKQDDLNLFNVLKQYFDKKDHKKFKQLLNEEEIQGKICFRSNANQLVLVFRQLHLNQKIIGQSSNTEKWICKYFTYFNKKNKVSDFDLGYVHKMLTSNSRKVLKSKRIEIQGLKHIIPNLY